MLLPLDDEEQRASEPPYITKAKEAGLVKLKKYTDIIQKKTVYSESMALDPRFKLRAFKKDPEYPFDKIADSQNILTLWESRKPQQSLRRPPRDGLLVRPSYLGDNSADVMEFYLNSPTITPDAINSEDHVTFWDSQKEICPDIFKLVQENYSAAVTSVATERLFSWARYMLPYTKNNTSTENVRRQVLLKSWVKFFGDQ